MRTMLLSLKPDIFELIRNGKKIFGNETML